ncbi:MULTISPECIES: AbrB/MazE/SpoVT family DNA-binding domain-containing protein [unclassified Bacillus (in: firmicutes)]|uniref:AbrB/MazE/SpoVT family DNA-binding domain-containing protein n=1 Tax=unclassified Bacillus (in: firmicutes) TaxID=185979 RepID=UPI0004140B34|nr:MULTISPECIES: AbrB/MazE/SpoVT family DNA-binding domain-containing protein [unclassified Bacillus (in: firmicutes)]QHZ48819.1 transcriptional regulator [Bacillus sp. NSP9.1]WFA05540.1 AbrB/MazE/SpoVT family DNA-binding domain-containing protein [Bacillus sp. HSf4]
MENAAFIRKMDDLGRVVLPKKIRKILKINERDPIEIFIEGEKIIFRKYLEGRACFVTGEVTDLNKTLSGGIVLSPEGARILLQDLLALRLQKEI